MVRLQGIVWDGEKTTSNYPYYLSGVVLTQGSGWSATTNGSGYFSTSANTTLNSLTVNTSGYRSVTISVPIFATHYDGSFVISGSLTQDATVSNGYAFITDNQKTFFANSLSGRILTIQGGIDDGDTGIIVGNTPNTILVGGVSGGGVISIQTVVSSTYRTSSQIVGLSNSVFYATLFDGVAYTGIAQVTNISGLVSGNVTINLPYNNIYTYGVGTLSGFGGVLLYACPTDV